MSISDAKKLEYNKNRQLKYAENSELYKARSAKFRLENPDKVKSWYINKGREYHRKYIKHKRETDINFKLASRLRIRMWDVIHNNKKLGSAVKDLGCTLSELKIHLESKFQPGMNWENHGKWHIDHIKPLASFNLSQKDQFLQACNYKNLQPLWALDNIRKKDKWEPSTT